MSERTSGRIMPRDKGAAPLDIVIAIIAFLAALALGASMLANRASDSWKLGLANRITVQILAPEKPDAVVNGEIEAALHVLRDTSGIAHAGLISEKDTLALVKPWLGSDPVIAELPLPRLIDAEITPGAPVDVAALRMRLKAAAPDSNLDDHSRWIGRLRAFARNISLAAYGILALIAIATAATVAFATRAGLDAHREIVELLHQMGATSTFIARAFEWHYFMATMFAATVGAIFAAALFVLAGSLEFAGLEAAPFLPPLALQPAEIGFFAAVPLVASLIALGTARISVLAALRRIY
jgi:cell division transport system permease protein